MVVLEGDNLDFGEDFELNVRAWNYVGGSNATFCGGLHFQYIGK